jgi:cell division protein FtsL
LRKILIALMILSIPLSVFFSVYRVYSYQSLEREVEKLKEEQADLFERNKRMIANIAIVSSPERIEKIAEEELDLSRIKPERKLRIVIDKDARTSRSARETGGARDAHEPRDARSVREEERQDG